MANEIDTLKLMEEVIAKEGLAQEVDWWTGQFLGYVEVSCSSLNHQV